MVICDDCYDIPCPWHRMTLGVNSKPISKGMELTFLLSKPLPNAFQLNFLAGNP